MLTWHSKNCVKYTSHYCTNKKYTYLGHFELSSCFARIYICYIMLDDIYPDLIHLIYEPRSEEHELCVVFRPVTYWLLMWSVVFSDDVVDEE